MNLVRPRWGQVRPPSGVRIDWSHPLANGLVMAYLPREGISSLIDIVTGTPAGPLTVTVGYNYRSGPQGMEGFGSTTGGFVFGGTSSFPASWPSSTSCSLLWRGWIETAMSGTNPRFCGFGGATSVLALRRVSATDFDVRAQSGATGFSVTSSTALLSSKMNTPLTIAGVRSIGTGGYTDAYLNGVEIGGRHSTDVAPPGTPATTFSISGFASASSGAFTSEVYAWSRPLGSDELVWLTAEPYAFFAAPGPKILYIDLGAGSASPKTVAITASTAAWSGRALSPASGAKTAQVTAATAAWSGRALSPSPAAKTTNITAAGAAWSARQLSPSPVAISRAITAAVAAWSARSLVPSGAARSTSVGPAQATWSAKPLVTSSGARTASITAALAAWSGQALSPSAFPRASLSPAQASWSARALSASGLARTAALTAAAASWHGQPLSVTGLAKTAPITPVLASWSASALSVLNILSVHLPPGQTSTVVRFTELTGAETRPNAGTSTLVQQPPTATR